MHLLWLKTACIAICAIVSPPQDGEGLVVSVSRDEVSRSVLHLLAVLGLPLREHGIVLLHHLLFVSHVALLVGILLLRESRRATAYMLY